MRIDYKRFIFARAQYQNRSGFEVRIITDKNYIGRTQQVTEATYNRFADLANSGRYPTKILSGDNGVGWEIYRFHHTPPAKPDADRITLPLAKPEKCHVEPDGEILWAI